MPGINQKKPEDDMKNDSPKGNAPQDVGQKDELSAYIEQLQRLQAEFENFKKREEREKARYMDFAKAGLLLKLLNFNDDFERTLSSFGKADIKTMKEGIEMLFTNFQKILKEEGVEPIKCVGEKLDPFRHEVLMHAPGKEDGVVLEELQKGFMFKGNVIRPSKVKVCKCVKDDEKRDEIKIENKDENAKTIGGE